MRIGIDIDDTLADSWNTFKPYYAKLFKVDMDNLNKSMPYYSSVKDNYTLDEYFKLIKPIYDEVTPIVPIKKDAKEVINKLHELGHKIIFITARGEGYTDSYKLTKDYLEQNRIYYDKIIVNTRDKAQACVNENIELFIDDSYKHCLAVANKGIEVLMMNAAYNTEYKEFKRVNNWQEIYEYIKTR